MKQSKTSLYKREPLPQEVRMPLDREDLFKNGEGAFPADSAGLQALSDALQRDSRRFDRLFHEEGSAWTL